MEKCNQSTIHNKTLRKQVIRKPTVCTIDHILPQSYNSATLMALTIKFFEILMDSRGGELDIGLTAELLGVSKRRLYDITGVLEGVGLLEKCTKNSVRYTSLEWSGNPFIEHEDNSHSKLNDLESALDAGIVKITDMCQRLSFIDVSQLLISEELDMT